MKKRRVTVLSIMFLVLILFQSCATILGGQVTACQKAKPAMGDQQREVRVGLLIADIILFWPGTIVDFATGAIYKPCITSRGYKEL